MAIKGQILLNSKTGDTYQFLETSYDSNGESVTMRMNVKSRGKQVPDHIHLLQEETFEVISGELTILYDNQERTLKPGEKITLPAGKPHNHFNKGNTPVVYVQTVTPALDFEFLVENLVGLSSDGKRPNGKSSLLQELVILRYIDSKTFLAGIPIFLQKVLMNILGPIGRAMGYRAIYRKYSGIEK